MLELGAKEIPKDILKQAMTYAQSQVIQDNTTPRGGDNHLMVIILFLFHS
jgi:hypothetical protein